MALSGSLSGRAFALWRVAFGLYFTWVCAELWPFLNELFTKRAGGIASREAWATRWGTHALTVHALWALVIACGVLIVIGRARRPAALLAWAVMLRLFWENGAMRSPEMPLVTLALLLLALAPVREPRWPLAGGGSGPAARYRDLMWIALAIANGSAGFYKLTWGDASWGNGTALVETLTTSTFRRTFYGDFFAAHAHGPLWLGTWASVGLEIGFPLLIWFRWPRALVWTLSFSMHCLALVLFNLAEVSLGMIVVHLFVLDDRLRTDLRAPLRALRARLWPPRTEAT